MQHPTTLRRRRRRLGPGGRASKVFGAAALCLIAGGGAFLSGGVVGASSEAKQPTINTPFATSISTAAGTWASVPMGHLDQPLNTFWQLFLLPAQGGSWTNHAGQLGIADNGGLLLAAPSSKSLLVAIRPSFNLKFSTLVTTESGRSWSPVPPVQGTIASLAAGTKDDDLALVKDAKGGRVAASSGGSGWRTVVTVSSLASSASGRACAPVALTAVAVGPSGAPLVGASCGRTGVVGVFAYEHGGWRLIGPKVPALAGRSRVDVLSLRSVGGQTTALLSFATRSGTELVDGWAEAGGAWRLSAGLSLRPADGVVSIGPVPGGGEFILYGSGRSDERLATANARDGSWVALPAPPADTATLAFPASGGADAIAANDTVMTDWVLDASASKWVRHQVVDVDILFGSSS